MAEETRHTTSEVRKMLNGDGNHYRVTDRFHHSRGRYFTIRGDSNLAKTFRSLIKHATGYSVIDCETRGDTFRAEIERDS